MTEGSMRLVHDPGTAARVGMLSGRASIAVAMQS
jgi:hypothetical protein